MLFSLISFLSRPFRALLGRPSSTDSSPLGPRGTTSTSSGSIPNYRYDVFISFSGADTRNTFVDHLYAHLTRKGIFVFKDDKKLNKGKSISEQLVQAIQDSRVSIIVFSENYASSTWCLEEMAVIHDCKQQSNQTVFPVFYDVDPSHVRHQSGVYKNAFDLHRRKFILDPYKVNRWKRAMTDLANSVGWDLRNKPEFGEIKNIVQEVIKVLGHKFSGVADDLIGIQPRVQALESLLKLSLENDDVRVLGIWGMSGIGKTTHAGVLYDKISHKFSACCFIQNVAKIYKNQKDGGTSAIQKQILRQTLDEENLEKCDPFEISRIIKDRLHKIKVLIVLNNVDQIEQLEELAIDPKMLFTGSRMIITTTDEHILKLYGADVIRHKVSLLNDNDARELFYRKAFRGEDQSSSCVELIPEVLKYVQRLPLAIRVIGSFLYTRDAIQWRDTLHRFEKNPHKKIMDVLEVSIEGLEYEEKEIFLHIACFFNEEREDYVKRILDCCVLYPHIGIPRLMEKSLITVRDEEIHMHEMLQELGKKIVRNQFPDEPGSWSRIWLCKDFCHFLTTKKGTNHKVKAIVLNKKEDISECSIDELSKLKNLKLLILYHKSFSGSLDFLSHELRYLLWHDYPFASLPSCFSASYLVELNMPDSSIKCVWEGCKNFPSLKRMDLSNSKSLIETPDFYGIPNLERLDLSGCTNLLEVHSSIGHLQKLTFLSLRNCSNLVSINFGSESRLCSLRVLHLSGCTKLEKMPDFTGAINLEYLEIDRCTSLSLVHDSIAALAKLTFLSLRHCKNLVRIPNIINTMRSLQTLDLCGCLKLTYLPVGPSISNSSSHLVALIVLDVSFCSLLELPEVIGDLWRLERLHLEGNHFVSLPDIIQDLHCLAYLNLSHCHKLELLPKIPWASGSSAGMYFKTVSGSRDHRSGFYLFDCPKLPNMSYRWGSFQWLGRLIQKPAHFRCGFDIVVPWNINVIPEWFNEGFDGGSVMRIKHFNMNDSWIDKPFYMNDNWIGFLFSAVFLVNNGPVVSSCPHSSSHQFYLSFESEETEAYFDMPLNVDMNKNKIDGSKYLWMIYISRQHCHFVKTGANITFKANHPRIEIIQWGMRSVFREDFIFTTRQGEFLPNAGRYTAEEGNKSSGPKIQIPYNWFFTEEEEAENVAAKAKENNISNVGL